MAGAREHEQDLQPTGDELAPAVSAPGHVALGTPAGIFALQRSAGNQAVVGMLGEQRLQRVPAARGDQTANLGKLNTFKTNADTRFRLTNDIATHARDVGDQTKVKLTALGNTYKTAYTTFRGVLNSAQQEAQNQQDWVNISVGIACGIAAGLVAAWALPATASAAWAISAQEAIIVAASSTAQGVGGAAASAGVSRVLPTVAGRQIDSSGLDPMIQEMQMWQKAAEIYRSGLEFADLGGALHQLTVNLADLIADVRVYAAGGESQLTDEAINTKVTQLEAKDAEMAAMNDTLTAKVAELERMATAVQGIDPGARDARAMERDIWHLWMATLPLNSNILDLDAIEDHIGPKGLGIVDFGWYTSDADENEAIENARNTAQMLRAQQREQMGGSGDVPADNAEQRRIFVR